MQKIKDQGSVLIFSLIILSVILIITLGIASATVIEKKMAGTTNKSIVSFQVADSGAEIILKKIKDVNYSGLISGLGNCSLNEISGNIGTGSDKNYKVTFFDVDGNPLACTDEISDINRIKSIGTYGQTSRAVVLPMLARNKIGANADVMVLIDYSISMSSSDLAKEKNAVIELINNLGSEYRVGIVFFSEHIVVQSLVDLSTTTNRQYLINFIKTAVTATHPGTNTSGAITRANQELLSGSNNRHGTNPQAIVLITDGVPDLEGGDRDYSVLCGYTDKPRYWSITYSDAALAASTTAKSNDINIFTIGISFYDLSTQACKDKANQLMSNMATSPLDYYSIDNFDSLKSTLDNLR